LRLCRACRRSVLRQRERGLGGLDLPEGKVLPVRIDLDPRANQPFASGSGHLCYNGELYNTAELRSRLEGEGVGFRSRSDTEVVLMALLTWGPEVEMSENRHST